MERPRRVALALGSGGARGYAHIGAIQVLLERGYEVVGIAGSSMGAMVGAVYGVGKLDEYAAWAESLSQLDVVRLLDPSVSAPGAIRAEKLMARVRDLLDGARIEDLPFPYTAVATDLFARKEVWFQRGPIDTAVRASIAIPGVVTPIVLNGRLLADGGVMDPVPLAPLSAVQADLTVAISLNGDRRSARPAGEFVVESAEPGPVEEWAERFRRSAAHLLDRDMARSLFSRLRRDGDGSTADEPADEPADDDLAGDGTAVVGGAGEPVEVAGAGEELEQVFGALPAGLSKLEMMNLSIEAMQGVLARYRLAGHPPDVAIAVPKDACRTLDFHRATEMIELGRELTVDALERAGWGVVDPVADPMDDEPSVSVDGAGEPEPVLRDSQSG